EEAAELLHTAVGSDLPAAAVAALEDRTEGWVAGLQLAALSLRGRADVTAFVEGFSGSHRYVLDYLAEEVLDRQPPPLREFLLETSVLERLSGPLCDGGHGRKGGPPAPRGASGGWSRSSGPSCSWCRWTRGAAGGASTSCSPTCCAPACTRSSPSGCPSCTGPQPPGWRTMDRPTRPWTTPWPPVTPPGRPRWSTGTPKRCCSAGRARPWPAGSPPCPPGPAPPPAPRAGPLPAAAVSAGGLPSGDRRPT